MKSRLCLKNGEIQIIETDIKEYDWGFIARIPKETIVDVEYVDFMYDYFTANVGDQGYFVANAGAEGTNLTRFTDREDAELVAELAYVACYGFSRGADAILGIATTLRCDFTTVLGVKDGRYYTYLRYFMDGDMPYEDIEVEYHFLKESDYSAMARVYREYMLTRKGCVPLKERCAADKRLAKAADSIEVRVRQGWKPVPSPVEYQTPETEPEMHVACTFDRVGDIAEEFKRQGIGDAEFCLVGWNSKGHDGRFPQIFPVEPLLGGEERLKELIQKVHDLEYGIVCHDDATAAYTIADCFDEEYLLKNKDGSLYKRPYCWSGGRPHKICPQRQYEKFEVPNQKKIAELGFEGIHYIDVITILAVLKCYDPKHPLNRGESAQWYKKIMELSRKNFGGFASESGYDFAAESMDYCMYADFRIGGENNCGLCDEKIPFWHMVYHGIILYNPSTATLNYMTKKNALRLKCIELGGRPLVCYYANFAQNNNWMGKEDFLCDTDQQLVDSVAKIKVMAQDYDLLKPERYEFIQEHHMLQDNVYETVYSNGTRVIVDYKKETFDIIR